MQTKHSQCLKTNNNLSYNATKNVSRNTIRICHEVNNSTFNKTMTTMCAYYCFITNAVSGILSHIKYTSIYAVTEIHECKTAGLKQESTHYNKTFTIQDSI